MRCSNVCRGLAWFGLGLLIAAPVAAQTRLPRPTVTRPTVMPATSGRYRVLITGFAVAKETVDDPRAVDGEMDEVYAAAAVVLWDRRTGQPFSVPTVVRGREYGDVGKGQFTGRTRAGTASPTGGLWSRNGPDVVPMEFDPRGSALPVPSNYQFPLLVFEGGLSDGVEALLIAPSLWESDRIPVTFDNYEANWRSGGVGKVLASPAVVNQLTSPTLASAVLPNDPGYQIASSLTTVFTGGLIGSYGFAGLLFQAQVDRPIGLAPGQQAANYQDRVVVVTREKLTSLAPGAGMTIAVPFWEPYNNFLNGVYTAYVRVERLQ